MAMEFRRETVRCFLLLERERRESERDRDIMITTHVDILHFI
jgi:hypothetical protein